MPAQYLRLLRRAASRIIASSRSLFSSGDALRRRQRMLTMIAMEEALSGIQEIPLRNALEAWCSVNAGEIAKPLTDPKKIPAAVTAARTAAIASFFPNT